MDNLLKEQNLILERKIEELSQIAMVDKLSLSGVMIVEIENPDSLEEKGILNKGKSKMKYFTKSGKGFTSLAIKDDFFGKLKAGVNFGNGSLYSNFATSVKNGLCTNLICNTVEDYKKQIGNAKRYLVGEYGVHTDFQDAVVNSIEINRTFRISSSIEGYRRPIELIAYCIPRKKRMNLLQDFKKKTGDGFQAETFVITSRKNTKNQYGKTVKSKQYEEIVFYDKTKQLEKVIFLSGNYMRVEIKVKGAAKIKKMLKTNKFCKLSDQSINDFFDEEIKNLVIGPYADWKQKRNKRLLKLLKSQRDGKHDWVVNTLLVLANEEIKNGVPVILDISEILPLIDQLGIKSSQRKYRIRENFKTQAQKRADVFCNGDSQKLQEILCKLQPKGKGTVSQQPWDDEPKIYKSGDIDKTA